MYKDVNGYNVYETIDELLSADVKELYEDSENYYFRLKPNCYYDNGAWVVNKNDNKVSFLLYTLVMMKVAENTAHQIDLSTLKKRIA